MVPAVPGFVGYHLPMKTILIEGIPGSGKTVLSGAVGEWLEARGGTVRYLTEQVQDKELFTDYWDRFDLPAKRMAREFLSRWRKVLKARGREIPSYVFDNALFNQAHYLMALDMEPAAIDAFYSQACSELLPYGPVIVSLEGDATVIAKRIMEERADKWTPRVIELFASAPYQRTRGRGGPEGMIEFMKDSAALRLRLLDLGLLPAVRCDVTAGDWETHTASVLEGLEQRWPTGSL